MPQYANVSDYLFHIENVEYIANNYSDHSDHTVIKLVICGDFNLPKVNCFYQDGLQYCTQADYDSVTK